MHTIIHHFLVKTDKIVLSGMSSISSSALVGSQMSEVGAYSQNHFHVCLRHSQHTTQLMYKLEVCMGMGIPILMGFPWEWE